MSLLPLKHKMLFGLFLHYAEEHDDQMLHKLVKFMYLKLSLNIQTICIFFL